MTKRERLEKSEKIQAYMDKERAKVPKYIGGLGGVAQVEIVKVAKNKNEKTYINLRFADNSYSGCIPLKEISSYPVLSRTEYAQEIQLLANLAMLKNK
jgi:hypothetical protein